MSLEHLRVDGVRCLAGVTVDLQASRNYIWGANGAGKTSFLEAIYLLSRGRSFRTRQTGRLLRRGAASLSVFGIVRGADGQKHRLGLEFAAGRLSSQIDGATASSQAEMLWVLPVHVLDPRLHSLIEAGPSERRRFIDAGVFHVEHSFLADWRQYRRVLGQRNAALKAGAAPSELALWTDPFLRFAKAVDHARTEYCDKLAEKASKLGEMLLGDQIELDYRNGWRRGISLDEALADSQERDRALGFTQVGPHRGDLRLEFAHGKIRDLASRGQQKLVAAALVIAQVELFEELTGMTSTVLVDDASAELDQSSQLRLSQALNALRSQQILTGLSLDALRPEPGFPVFHVEQGKVHPVL